MKKIAILLSLGLLLTFGAQAQKSNLKGPEYKNRKPWKDSTPAVQVYAKTGETLKGPEAKNAKPMERKSGKTVLVSFGSKKDGLMGPEYKNQKPWVDEKSDAMYAKDKQKKSDDGDGMTGSR